MQPTQGGHERDALGPHELPCRALQHPEVFEYLSTLTQLRVSIWIREGSLHFVGEWQVRILQALQFVVVWMFRFRVGLRGLGLGLVVVG